MKRGKYKVYFNSSLKDGDLDLSHAVLKGKLSNEILIRISLKLGNGNSIFVLVSKGKLSLPI